MDKIKLSVVIPAYNETANLNLGSLDKIEQYLKKQKYQYEVLIIDDGSTDNTANIISSQIKDKKNFSLIKNTHGGKAITVMTGLIKAYGEIVLFTDMDQATPLDQVEKFFPKFENGYDVVIGLRKGRKGAPTIRKISAYIFSFLRNIILGLPLSDTQCGFKAFTQPAIKTVFPEMLKTWQAFSRSQDAAVNAGFDIEALYLAKKRGFKIAEVPVEWHYVGSKRVHVMKDAIEALKDMLRIKINDLKGKYD